MNINLYKFIAYLLLLQNIVTLQAQQPTTIFCHGIVDNHTQAERYEQFLQEPKIAFDFPDAQTPQGWNLNNLVFQSCSLFGKSVNRDAMHMGQGTDIETLKNQIEPDKNYILYGLSRGGATAVSYLAQYNPTNVQALILDAAPADVVTSVDELQHGMGCKLASDRSTQEYIFSTIFPAYQTDSTPPIHDIINIKNKNLPIFIVHAKTDTRVHIRSAWQYYQAFLQAGFTNVYLCELSDGIHAHYMKGNDKDLYIQALHSFYKKYGFAFNPDYATMDVSKLQTSLQKIQGQLTFDHIMMQKNYEKQRELNILALQSIALLAAAAYLYTSQFK